MRLPGATRLRSPLATAIDKCDREFYRCGTCATPVTIEGAEVAFHVDVVSALRLDVFRDRRFLRRRCAPPSSFLHPRSQPVLHRVALAVDRLRTRVPLVRAGSTVFDLPKLEPDTTIKLLDFSQSPAQITACSRLPTARPSANCSPSPASRCALRPGLSRYFVHHPKRSQSRQVHRPDAGHGTVKAAPIATVPGASSVRHVLAACTIKFEKPRPGTSVIKLSTPDHAYVWTGGVTSASWQKLDDGRGTGLLMQRKNQVVIKDFQVPDLGPTCVDAHARPTETAAFGALVLDDGRVPGLRGDVWRWRRRTHGAGVSLVGRTNLNHQ